MKIRELEEYAQNNGFDSLEFTFVNLLGEVTNCKWLDAYFGLFTVEGSEGFITVNNWIELTGDIFDFTIKT